MRLKRSAWIRFFVPVAVVLLPAALPAGEFLAAEHVEEESVSASLERMGEALAEAGQEIGASATEAGQVLRQEGERIVARTVDEPGAEFAEMRRRIRHAVHRGVETVERAVVMLKAEIARLRGD